jgi:Ras-related protein Rap-1B
MKTGQGFLLVFSITSLSSLSELAELREQIIRIKDDDNVPIVIVGNKSDLEDERKVSRARAFAVSQGWGNAPYYETSARRRGEFGHLHLANSPSLSRYSKRRRSFR